MDPALHAATNALAVIRPVLRSFLVGRLQQVLQLAVSQMTWTL